MTLFSTFTGPGCFPDIKPYIKPLFNLFIPTSLVMLDWTYILGMCLTHFWVFTFVLTLVTS